MGKFRFRDIEIRGAVYPNTAAAARALGVTPVSIRRAIHDGRLDTVGLKSHPVTVHGVAYPSMAAAARANGVTDAAIGAAARNGSLHRVGTGAVGVEPMRVMIRGQVFDNARAAADHFGVTVSAVHNAIRAGNPDRIGMKPRQGRANAHPVTIGGLSFPSKAVAGMILGFSTSYVSRAMRRRSRAAHQSLFGAGVRLSDAVARGFDLEAACRLLSGDRQRAAGNQRLVMIAQLSALGHRNIDLAARFGISQTRVARILTQAREAGVLVMAAIATE